MLKKELKKALTERKLEFIFVQNVSFITQQVRNKMNYKQILEDILELDERITIIRGFGDVIVDPLKARTLGYLPVEMFFKEFKSDNYCVVMGRGTDELIIEAMSEAVCDVEMEGEWEFSAILKWIPGEYDEYGRCTMRDYLEVQHIEFKFIQTFKQRERQEKLDTIFNNDLDLFKL